MATIYITREGDVLDAICWRYYGDEQPLITVLAANPGLAERGEVYTSGISIVLPDREAPVVQESVSLWE